MLAAIQHRLVSKTLNIKIYNREILRVPRTCESWYINSWEEDRQGFSEQSAEEYIWP